MKRVGGGGSVWGTLTPQFGSTGDGYELTGDTITIGRVKANDVVVSDGVVSGLHLRLTYRRADSAVFAEDLSTNGTWFNGKRVRKKKRHEVKSGLRIVLNGQRAKEQMFVLEWPTKTSAAAAGSAFEDSYDLKSTLGSGAFATVFNATHKRTGRKYAVKVIEKKRFALIQSPRLSAKQKGFMSEVEILRQCDHPNITRCYDVFDTAKKLYIVLEARSGHG